MHTRIAPLLFALIVVGASSLLDPQLSWADGSMRPREGQRWWRGELSTGSGVCEVKIESKPGEFKREIKCKDGIGASWMGEWKTEFRDGSCWIKQEAKREQFKEEIQC